VLNAGKKIAILAGQGARGAGTERFRKAMGEARSGLQAKLAAEKYLKSLDHARYCKRAAVHICELNAVMPGQQIVRARTRDNDRSR